MKGGSIKKCLETNQGGKNSTVQVHSMCSNYSSKVERLCLHICHVTHDNSEYYFQRIKNSQEVDIFKKQTSKAMCTCTLHTLGDMASDYTD